MKHKLCSLALSAVMMMSLATTSFATTITISGDHGEGVQFSAYKLLNLTTSLVDATCHTADPVVHEDDCWNYSYTVNDTHRATLQSVIAAADGITTGGDASGDVSDAAIIAYIGSLTDQSDDIRDVADALFTALKDTAADKQTVSGSGEFTDMDQGYYLIVQNSVDTEGTTSKSLAILNTAGQDAVILDPKSGVPTIDKEVEETNESDGTKDSWGQSADYDGADEDISFRITTTVPENITNYEHYSHIICDTIDDSLVVNFETLKVTAFGRELSTTHYTVKKGADVGGSETMLDTDTDFEVVITDLFEVATAVNGTVDENTTVVVEYEASFDAAEIVYGSTGQKNYAHLRWTNDPYWDGQGDSPTSKTEQIEVGVYTYVMKVDKIKAPENDGDPVEYLTGAEFKLQKYDYTAGDYRDYLTSTKNDAEITVGDNTIPAGAQFTFAGLDAGKYKLVETIVPDGFNAVDPLLFEVRTELVQKEGNSQYTGPGVSTLVIYDEGGNSLSDGTTDAIFSTTVASGEVTTAIENATGSRLPSTGGAGIYLIYGAGILLLCAGVVLVVKKNRKNEDSAK